MTQSSQRLISSNVSPDVTDALGARVSDPLWMLARQWQMGEFEAEIGGRLVEMYVTHQAVGIEEVVLGEKVEVIEPETPLEALIEAEKSDGTAPAWDPQSLSYQFTLKAHGAQLIARNYDGRALDWHDFSLVKGTGVDWTKVPEEHYSALPGWLHFPGSRILLLRYEELVHRSRANARRNS